MTEFILREATPDDVTGVLRIAERGWNATYTDILSQETIDEAIAEWYDMDTIREFIENEDVAYFVVEEDGDIVGYVSGGPSSEENVATLGAIYVDPDYWNEGIGTALLREFEKFCRRQNYETVRFQMLSENDIGESFYRKQGYEIIEKQETDLFGETVSENLFRRKIQPTEDSVDVDCRNDH